MPGNARFLLEGLVLGFSIAAPVGPIGLLCIRRSLQFGRLTGLATGIGAATADAVYGAIAGFGLTGVTTFMVGQQYWLTLLGALFLCWLGVRTVRAHPATATEARSELPVRHAYLSALALTLTNPTTILTFVGAFAALGLAQSRGYLAATALVVGVFSGSALWWLILSALAARLRSRVDARWMQRVNWVSGAVLLGFGLYALIDLRR